MNSYTTKTFLLAAAIAMWSSVVKADDLADGFLNPPDSARPGVYWYFMDGNLNGKEMTADLEAMKQAGLGNLVFLEVNVGVPPGPVKFMSAPWQDLFAKAVHDAERFGLDISLGTGPGWCGSGGPWVKPEQSMQHLVSSTVNVSGPTNFNAALPLPVQRTTQFHKLQSPFYEDVAVFAFPKRQPIIAAIDEKALFIREPFTSAKQVKPFLPTSANYAEPEKSAVIQPDEMLDLTTHLGTNGVLNCNVPAGEWTILRMGRRTTGASSRPAPEPGVGLECDKLDAQALAEHLDHYVGILLGKIGSRAPKHGLTTLHIDSWEMGAQNWTGKFLEEFKRRRGYDAHPLLPIYTGRAIESVEKSERFLWDVRLTAQELVLEQHAKAVKQWAAQKGLSLSIEPYDMNPAGDLDLGSVADVPMAEFWSAGYGFNSAFSCVEASSIAHVMGRPIVSAEAFTATPEEAWRQYPTSMKNQGDWAFAMGINRFVYHTFAHQALGEEYKPGLTMGPYGVHWDRGQTWWPLVSDYHRYVSRCSEMLRQGVTVSDVLYLTPEGAPQIFLPPGDALEGAAPLADKKGYGFDGCSPNILLDRAEVKHGLIVFPGGTSYRLLVLPKIETMTPRLLRKICELVRAGATVVGSPPQKSPSLSNYPACDEEVKSLSLGLWGSSQMPTLAMKRSYGNGYIHWGGEWSSGNTNLYPAYALTAGLLRSMGVAEDFSSIGSVRYGHRRTTDRDIYFVANRNADSVQADCRFRVGQGRPQLWNPVTGERRALPQFKQKNGLTAILLTFAAFQSFFIIFDAQSKSAATDKRNFPSRTNILELTGAWDVTFDPQWGGPAQVTFDSLTDWSQRAERGIKYYSGIATYRKTFAAAPVSGKKIFLDLGVVHDLARVRLNGKDLGVVWCAPWQVDITDVLKTGGNQLEIEVANRWVNRLVGDQQPADAKVRTVRFPSGLLGGNAYPAGRYTFETRSLRGGLFKADSPLLPSGLLGPVTLQILEENPAK
ncbi:MAG: glycosyl hydrolase [Verrucomicrobiota bacterium]